MNPYLQFALVLAGLVAGQLVAFGVAAQAVADEIVRDPVDAGVHLRVGQSFVAPHQHFVVRKRLRDGTEHGGQVETCCCHGPSFVGATT